MNTHVNDGGSHGIKEEEWVALNKNYRSVGFSLSNQDC